MKRSSNTREHILGEAPQENERLIREIYRAYTEEASAVFDYGYAAMLLEKPLPAVAELFESIALTEMKHHEALGELLRDLGAPFALRMAVRTAPYHLQEDEDSHAPVVAAQIIKDRIRDEKNAFLTYRGLARLATTERARKTLTALAEDEQEHAAALQAAQERLSKS